MVLQSSRVLCEHRVKDPEDSTKICAVVRSVTPKDIDQLHHLISSSIKTKLKLSKSELKECLFGAIESSASYSSDDPTIELDVSLIESNRPICQSIVVVLNETIIGYVVYHYYYAPWKGHFMMLDDIFVTPEHRLKGFAKSLIRHCSNQCRREGLHQIVFNSYHMEPSLIETLVKYKVITYRDDKTDWSVYRVEFDTE